MKTPYERLSFQQRPHPPKKKGRKVPACHFSTQKPGRFFRQQPPEVALHSPKRKNNSLRVTMFSQPIYPVHLGVPLLGLPGPRGTGHLLFNPARQPLSGSTRPLSLPTHMVAPGYLFEGLLEKMLDLIGGVWGRGAGERCFFLFLSFFFFPSPSSSPAFSSLPPLSSPFLPPLPSLSFLSFSLLFKLIRKLLPVPHFPAAYSVQAVGPEAGGLSQAL